MRILGVQQEHLRADGVGVLVLDLGAEEDDPVLQERLIDVVVEAEAVAAAGVVGIGSRRPKLIGGTEKRRSWGRVHVGEPTPARVGSRAEIGCVRCGRRRVKITPRSR